MLSRMFGTHGVAIQLHALILSVRAAVGVFSNACRAVEPPLCAQAGSLASCFRIALTIFLRYKLLRKFRPIFFGYARSVTIQLNSPAAGAHACDFAGRFKWYRKTRRLERPGNILAPRKQLKPCERSSGGSVARATAAGTRASRHKHGCASLYAL